MSGSFDVLLDDGRERRRFHLNRSYYGLYIAPLIWRELDNFSSGSVCLVLASEVFDEADYFRDYRQYLAGSHNSLGNLLQDLGKRGEAEAAYRQAWRTHCTAGTEPRLGI